MHNVATELDSDAISFLGAQRWRSVRSAEDDASVAEQPSAQRYQVQVVRSSTLADAFDNDDYLLPAKPEDDVLDGRRIAKLLSDAVSAFCDRIERDLEQDREEAVIDGEVPPTNAAAEACARLASIIAPRVALAAELKWAAFTEDTGGVSLVLQSLITDRRLDYRVSPDGTSVSAIRIDENMRSESFVVPIDDERLLRERAAWVVRRA